MVKILDLLFCPNRFFPPDPKQLFSAVLWQFVIWLFLVLINNYGGVIPDESRILSVVLLAAVFSSLFVYILSFTTQLGLFLLKKNQDYVPTFKISVYSALVFSLYWLIGISVESFDLLGFGADYGLFNQILWFISVSHMLIVQIVGIRQSHDVDMMLAAMSVMIFWIMIAMAGAVAFSVNPEGFSAMARIPHLGIA